MISINCIAIDDEPPALRQIEEYIEKVPYLKLLAGFQNPIDSMNYIKDNPIDLIFLDIQMEELSGIEFLKLFKKKPAVILTTAYDSYALEAFDLEVDDYLLKPISFERFIKATEKVYNMLILKSNQYKTITETDSIEKTFFFVKTEFKIQKVNFEDILYIEGMKEYLRIVLKDEKIMTKQSFIDILTELPKSGFVRVHKSFIISLNKIKYIRNNRIYINDDIIPVGSTYRSGFMQSIKK